MVAKVRIAELRRIADQIFEHIERDLEVHEVEIQPGDDLYWEVAPDDQHRMMDKPEVSMVGKLSEDMEFLEEILKDRSQAVAAMLTHLAPILRYLGQRLER